MYGIDWQNFNFLGYARDGVVWICRKNGKPVGIMMARVYSSIFNPEVKILFQDLLYVTPGTARAAHMLMTQFIDFGRMNANHIISAITPVTNIKGRSLEKLGFKKLETLYRLEAK